MSDQSIRPKPHFAEKIIGKIVVRISIRKLMES